MAHAFVPLPPLISNLATPPMRRSAYRLSWPVRTTQVQRYGEKHRCCSAHVPATTGVVVVAVMTGAMAGAR